MRRGDLEDDGGDREANEWVQDVDPDRDERGARDDPSESRRHHEIDRA